MTRGRPPRRDTGLSLRAESPYIECLQEEVDDEAHGCEMREGREGVRGAFLLVQRPRDRSADGISWNKTKES